MKLRTAATLAFAFLLCGCTDADWQKVLSFDNGPSSAAANTPPDYAPPPQQQADAMPPQIQTADAAAPAYSVTQTVTTVTSIAPTATVRYCRSVAQNTGAAATRDGMDGPAQQQAADATYRQCMTLYGGTAH